MEILFPLFLIIMFIGGIFPLLNLGGLFLYFWYFYKVSRDMVLACQDDVDLFVKEERCVPYTLMEDLFKCGQEQRKQRGSGKSFYEYLAQAVWELGVNNEEQGDTSYLGRKLLVGQIKFYLICNVLMFFNSFCSTTCATLFDFGKKGNECGRYIMMACFVMLSLFLVLDTITFIIILVKRGKVFNLIKEAFQLYDSKDGMSSRIYCISCIALFALAIVQMWSFYIGDTTTGEVMFSFR